MDVPCGMVKGQVQLFSILPFRGWVPAFSPPADNLLMFEWAALACRRLASDDFPEFRISGFYFEYNNVASPNDPVSTPPPFDRSTTINYYLNLPSQFDWLRVPITLTSFRSTDLVSFPNKNAVTFYGQSAGTVGMNGSPFSHVNNSKIYACGLVALRDQGDFTQDIIFARISFENEPSKQLLKPAGGQVAGSWEVKFL